MRFRVCWFDRQGKLHVREGDVDANPAFPDINDYDSNTGTVRRVEPESEEETRIAILQQFSAEGGRVVSIERIDSDGVQ